MVHKPIKYVELLINGMHCNDRNECHMQVVDKDGHIYTTSSIIITKYNKDKQQTVYETQNTTYIGSI